MGVCTKPSVAKPPFKSIKPRKGGIAKKNTKDLNLKPFTVLTKGYIDVSYFKFVKVELVLEDGCFVHESQHGFVLHL